MEKFVRKIVSMMKEEKLFAWQGGPIILAQVHFVFLAEHYAERTTSTPLYIEKC